MDKTVVLQYEKDSSIVKIKKKNLNRKNLFLTGDFQEDINFQKLNSYNLNIINEIITIKKEINLSNINNCDLFICNINKIENEKEIFTYLGAFLINKEFINSECKIFIVCPNEIKEHYKNDKTFNDSSIYHLNNFNQIYEIFDNLSLEKSIKI